MMNFYPYLKLLMKLFILINPIGLIPIFITSIDSIIKKERKIYNICINLIMFLILLFSFLLGKEILSLFDLNIDILQITGGFLISLNSLSILCDDCNNSSNINKKNISYIKLLTPMSFPLMAGPSSIAMLISYSTSCNNFLEYFFSILSIMFFSFFCWLFFEFVFLLRKYLSDVIVLFFNKIFSIILFSFGIQMILLGIKNFFLL